MAAKTRSFTHQCLYEVVTADSTWYKEGWRPLTYSVAVYRNLSYRCACIAIRFVSADSFRYWHCWSYRCIRCQVLICRSRILFIYSSNASSTCHRVQTFPSNEILLFGLFFFFQRCRRQHVSCSIFREVLMFIYLLDQVLHSSSAGESFSNVIISVLMYRFESEFFFCFFFLFSFLSSYYSFWR